jgi:PKD repeat protein
MNTKSVFGKLIVALSTVAVSLPTLAQNWREPLENPNVSFYDVQAAFYSEWGAKEQQLYQAQQDNTLLSNKWPGDDPANPTPMPFMKGGYKQFKRWEYFLEPRVYPSGDLTLPSSTFERFNDYLNQDNEALAQYMQRYGAPIGSQTNRVAVQAPTVLSNPWQFVGPNGFPTGGGAGRVNCVRFDPTNTNIMYAGTPAGGLWRSTNAGVNWTLISSTDALASIGVTDIAIDPTNTQVLYIATGDGNAGDTYSIGVLKSTDGGATWNTTGLNWTVNLGRTISKLIIHPTNNQILLAATSNGVYRTTDAGATWTQVRTGNFKDMELKPGDPNTVYVAGTTFWRSTNNGVAWTQVTANLPASNTVSRLAIGVSPANPNYVYVLAANATNYGFTGVYRATDSGVTFAQRSSSPNLLGWSSTGADTGGQGWYDLAIAVSETNADVVVVGGVNIWRSTNGGTGWTINGHWTGTGAPYVHADIHDLIFLPGSGTTYYSGNDGGVFRTTNSGGAWTDQSADLDIAQIYRIGLSASNASLWITGHQDNGSNIRNGANYYQTLGGDGMDCFIDRTNNNVMYAEYYNGAFNRSTNGGASWTGITTGLTGTAPWVTAWYQDPATANTIYCGRTNMFRSTNQGTNWTQLTALPASPTGTVVDFRIAPSNNQIIYVARATGLFKTTNAGTSWTTITGTLPVGSAAITRVAVAPNDPNTVYVTFSGYSGGNKVFRSTDGGATWTNFSTGLPNIPANCITVMPGSTTGAVYIGMDVGVYYRDNTFTSWQPYFTGLTNAPVFDIEIYQGTGKVRAATYGRGVWEADIYNPGSLAPVADFAANQTIVCAGNGVNFTDMSSFTPTSWSWTFTGGSPATSTAQNPTNIVWSTPGTYQVSLTATNANGSDAETKTAYITVLGSSTPPLVEGFESTTFLPTNWVANNINNDAIFWERTNTGFSSSFSARFDNYNLNVAGAKDEMWAPRMSWATLTNCTLTFDVAYARYNATYSDTLQVMISTDCGATWTQIYLKGGTTLSTAADNTNAFVPTSAQWRNESVNLNTYAGQSSVIVKFVNRGAWGNILYVDNINITGQAAALPNAAFTASTTTVCAGSPVNFTDNSTNNPTSWSWTFPSGTPASATTQNVTGVIWNTAGTYTVTHTATNGSGTGTQTLVITVNPAPSVTTTATNTTICAGNSTTLTGSGASTYAWMPGNLTGASVNVSPTTTTTYTVTGTSAAGCTNTATRTITVNPLPTVTTTASNTTICAGNSTTLNASGASTYNWMPGNLTGSSVTVSPTSSTTYTVTGTAANGCTNTSTRTITVNPTPTVTTTASNTTICAGNSTTLNASGASTYNWMPGNLTGSSVTVSPTTTTTYTVTGTSANGCTNTSTRTITVNAAPTVTTTASNATICAGNSTTLNASGASTYNWMPGNLTGSSVTVSPTTTTTYTVTGTAANGCTNTSTRTITVNPAPNVSSTAANNSICVGNSTTLSATGASTYNWMPGNLTGASVTVSPTTTTTYTVTGTAANGCTNTSVLTVTVNPTPTVTTTASNTSVCVGNSATLTASGATTYTWMPGNLTGSSVTVSPTTTTTYTVTGTNGTCTGTSTRTITVNPLPNVSSTAANGSVCDGSSTTLTASGASTYTWMPGNLTGSSVSVAPNVATTYTVTGTAANGCTNTSTVSVNVNALPTVSASAASTTICTGNTTTLTGSGANTYTWMPGNLSGASVNVTPATTTTYTVTGIDANGCSNTGTVQITVGAQPVVTASAANNSICDGSSTTLTASGTATYTWMPGNLTGSSVSVNPAATTTYTVTGVNGPGCQNTATVTVVVNALPNVAATASSASICVGSTVTLTASGASTYVWQPSNATGSSVVEQPSATITYTVIGTDANGCDNSGTVTVNVNNGPVVTASGNTTICPGEQATLTASGAVSYVWQPGGQTTTTITDTPATTTTYTVTGTDGNGCTSTTTITVTVGTNPATPAVTVNGNILTSTVTGASYQWFLNGVPIVGEVNQSTTALTPGSYTVEVYDANGCASGQSAPVVITDVEAAAATTQLAVYPNPTNGMVMLTLGQLKDPKYVLEVHNALGQIVYREQLSVSGPSMQKELNLGIYGTGVYEIRIIGENSSTHVRAVVQ